MFGLFAVIILCSLTGLMIFAKYYDCDPVSLDNQVRRDYTLCTYAPGFLTDFV